MVSLFTENPVQRCIPVIAVLPRQDVFGVMPTGAAFDRGISWICKAGGHLTDKEYPVLKLTKLSEAVMTGEKPFLMKAAKEEPKTSKNTGRNAECIRNRGNKV